MSWAEEQPWFGLEDLVLELEEKRMEAKSMLHKGYWLQNNGKYIQLTAMTDKHLRNCINMIEESRLNRKYALPYLYDELKRRENERDELIMDLDLLLKY